MKQESDHSYMLTITVHNQPGVLVRCAQVFARRGHNIETVAVTPHASDTRLSDLQIGAFGKKEMMSQIVAQLQKLVDVVTVTIKEES